MYLLVRELPGHPDCVTFGNIKFHLPIGLQLCKVISNQLEISYSFTCQHTLISKEADRLPDIFRKIINKNEKKDRS